MVQSEDTIELPKLISEPELNVEELETVDGTSNDDGFVYCIAEIENGKLTGYFKVGTASDTKKRLWDLHTGNVRQLSFGDIPTMFPTD